MVVVALVGCERHPVFDSPPAQKGGFLVQCLSVTDFQHRFTLCDPTQQFHNNTGGCACAQGGTGPNASYLNVPIVTANGEPAAALAFNDPSCTTTYLSTCMPRVLPTTAKYKEPGTPMGQVRMDNLLERVRDYAAKVDALDFPSQADIETAERAATDANAEITRACRLSHFGYLATYIFGWAPGTPEWSTATTNLGLAHGNVTSTLDGLDLSLGGWGLVKPPPPEYRAYVTHPLEPVPSTCNNDLIHPFGFSSVLGLSGRPGYASNAPVKQPGGGTTPRIARRESVILDAGSSALLTVSTISTPTMLTLNGSMEVSLHDCDATHCTADLSSLSIGADPFTLQGHHVAVLRVASVSASGVLQGNTLAFTSFDGTLEAQLPNHDYAFVPVTGGTLLANWDATNDRFVLAFNLPSVLEDGTEVSLDGSVFGHFANTAPVAKATLAQPVVDDSSPATVECASPTGTSYTLSSTQTTDRESSVKARWFDETANLISSTENVTLTNQPVGHRTIQLIAYDDSGLEHNDLFEVEVVDTEPPVITAQSICIAPGNHRSVLVELGRDLVASAVDACTGDAASSLRITDAKSSSNTGVLGVSDNEVCLSAERAGTERAGAGRTYTIRLEAQDPSGNTGYRDVTISIPHDGPIRGCTKPQKMRECDP